MFDRARFVVLLIVAVAVLLFTERAMSARAAARTALEEAERENAALAARLEAERIAAHEAQAEAIRLALSGAKEDEGRTWTTRPVARPRPAAVESKAPEARQVALDGVRERLRAIEGRLAPAAVNGPRGLPAAPTVVEAARPLAPDDPPAGTGLRGEYWKYKGEELTDLPDLARRLPTLVRVDAKLEFADGASFKLPFLARNMAVRWCGFLFAPDDGVYTLTSGSDAGMRVYVDGRRALENGGLHPFVERSADLFLARGFHALEVRYFAGGDGAAAVLGWVPVRGDPGPIPTKSLYPADTLKAEVVPKIERIEPERAHSGQAVTIEGSGFPGPPEAVEATFDGVDMDARAVDGRRLVATVPPGVDQGAVVVRVRDASSLGYSYTCGDVFGLLGEYARAAAADAPSPEPPAPFRRVEPVVAFGSDGAFGLPFPPHRMTARFTGSLNVREAGRYGLRVTSGDAARLTIDGTAVIDIEGAHGLAAGIATADLGRGLHDILLECFEGDAPAELLLEWMRPGETSFGVVPARALYPPAFSTRMDAPRIAEIRPPAVSPEETFEVLGANFAGYVSGDRVLLNGQPVPVLSSSPVRIVATAPANAATGSVVVQSAELVSDPAPLTIVGRGLQGAYYRFDEDLAQLPAFSTLAPTLQRIDPQVWFGEAFSFSLPFRAERFGVVWTGAIEAPLDGSYHFDLSSDDGSRLLIDGASVIENDGLHESRSRGGDVTIAAGRHAIEVDYFQNLGPCAIDLSWRVPGQGVTHVPPTALYPETP